MVTITKCRYFEENKEFEYEDCILTEKSTREFLEGRLRQIWCFSLGTDIEKDDTSLALSISLTVLKT